MVLVGQYDSPFVRRVAVTLHCYGVSFERNTLSIFSDAAAMQKINPLIRIPSLVLDDGTVLFDSVAIVDWLDEACGGQAVLVPTAGLLRRAILQVAAIALGIAEKAGQIVYERFFHDAGARSVDWDARCVSQLDAGLAHLEAGCGSPWSCSAEMSHADVMIGCMVGYLRLRVPERFAEERYPKLEAISVACESSEGFTASRISANEVMPGREAGA